MSATETFLADVFIPIKNKLEELLTDLPEQNPKLLNMFDDAHKHLTLALDKLFQNAETQPKLNIYRDIPLLFRFVNIDFNKDRIKDKWQQLALRMLKETANDQLLYTNPEDGTTIIHWICYYGYEKIFIELLNKLSSEEQIILLTQKSNPPTSYSPIDWLIASGNTELLNNIFTSPLGSKLIHGRKINTYEKNIQLYLDELTSNSNINAEDKDKGKDKLQGAANRGLKYIEDIKKVKDIKDALNKNECSNASIIDSINAVDNPSLLSMTDNKKKTLLMYAASCPGRSEIIKPLLTKSTNTESLIDKVDIDGNNAVIWAASCGQLKSLEALLDYQPQIDLSIVEKSLSFAAQEGHETILRFLIKKQTEQDLSPPSKALFDNLYGIASTNEEQKICELITEFGTGIQPTISNTKSTSNEKRLYSRFQQAILSKDQDLMQKACEEYESKSEPKVWRTQDSFERDLMQLLFYVYYYAESTQEKERLQQMAKQMIEKGYALDETKASMTVSCLGDRVDTLLTELVKHKNDMVTNKYKSRPKRRRNIPSDGGSSSGDSNKRQRISTSDIASSSDSESSSGDSNKRQRISTSDIASSSDSESSSGGSKKRQRTSTSDIPSSSDSESSSGGSNKRQLTSTSDIASSSDSESSSGGSKKRQRTSTSDIPSSSGGGSSSGDSNKRQRTSTSDIPSSSGDSNKRQRTSTSEISSSSGGGSSSGDSKKRKCIGYFDFQAFFNNIQITISHEMIPGSEHLDYLEKVRDRDLKQIDRSFIEFITKNSMATINKDRRKKFRKYYKEPIY